MSTEIWLLAGAAICWAGAFVLAARPRLTASEESDIPFLLIVGAVLAVVAGVMAL